MALERRCWASHRGRDRGTVPFEPPAGYPLPIGLQDALGPGDFPPRKLDPHASSAPLVSAESRHGRSMPSPFAERPTQNDLVDLITGQPLYQEIDFELPFGSAMFRHVRTHAPQVGEQLALDTALSPDFAFGYNPSEWFWDWNGRFWMMSENPLLLVDASYQFIGQPDTQITYFIPDSHHAVPFVKQSTGQYVAPPWFDGTLTARSEGATTYFDVRTDRGSVIFTFKLMDDDNWTYKTGEPPNEVVHDTHTADKLGFPHYAIIQSIRDRFGNAVRYYYDGAELAQSEMDVPDSEDCEECTQNCNATGQISRIELVTAESPETPAWTLVYSYREFAVESGHGGAGILAPGNAAEDGNFYERMLHSIHVYEGAPSALPSGHVLGWRHFVFLDPPTCSQRLESFDDYEAVDEEQLLGIASGWSIRARYVYSEPGTVYARAAEQTPYRAAHVAGWGTSAGLTLLKSSVTRADSGENTAHTTRTVYRYTGDSQPWLLDLTAPDGAITPALGLRFVFSDAILRRIIGHATNQTISQTENKVFELDDCADPCVQVDRGDGTQYDATLEDIADIALQSWDIVGEQAAVLDFGGVGGAFDDLVEELGFDIDRTLLHPGGIREFIDHRGQRRLYRITRMRGFAAESPIDPELNPLEARDSNDERFFVRVVPPNQDYTAYRWPYKYFSPIYRDPWSDPPGALAAPPGTARFHVAVVDEYPPDANPDSEPWISRRVVEMNAAGFVLRERRWRQDGGVTSTGFGESLVYDGWGRVRERQSAGWSTLPPDTEAENQTNAGLILTYAYQHNPEDIEFIITEDLVEEYSREGPIEEAVKLGTEGEEVPLRSVIYHPTRSELVIHEKRYPEPGGDAGNSAGTINQIWNGYEFGDVAGATDEDQPLIYKQTVSSAGPRTEGGPNAFSAVLTLNNDNGNTEWTALGSYATFTPGSAGAPGSLADAIQVFAAHTQHDDKGRKIREVIDVNTAIEGDEAPSAEFERVAETGLPALHLVTTYEHHPIFGPRKIVFPNGRESYTSYYTSPDDEELWVYAYPVVLPPPQGSDPLDARLLQPPTVTMIRGGQLQWVKTLAVATPMTWPPTYENINEDANVISTSVPSFDVSGRMTGMKVVGVVEEGADPPDTLSATIDYHHSGDASREQAPDGTITRYLYDNLSRLVATFRGTLDQNDHWYPTGCDAEADPNDECVDNMTLVETRTYGGGWRDLNQVVEVRHYREEPTDIYNPALYGSAGWVTYVDYDKRLRPCWTEDQVTDDGDPETPLGRLNYTLTWYDNLGRTRFVARFGDTAPGIDPRALALDDAAPTAAEILAAGPLSLSESIYNRAGLAAETRTYKVTDTSGDSYLSTRTYYDHAGRPIEVHSPAAPVQQHTFDAKGRQVLSASLARNGASGALVELARTETVFDEQDRATQRTTRERLAGDSMASATLSPGNSVATYSHTWYDKAGRVIASADYGTAASGDTFTSTSSGPTYDPESIPDSTLTGPRVTTFEYDDRGRQVAVHNPDGTVSRSEYDDLGRMTAMVENADSTSAELVVRTEYAYDEDGRLSELIAIRPDGEPDQHTRLEYGAPVVDAGFTALSVHNGWVGKVFYPDPADGEAGAAPDFTFEYFSDGSVASRTDARGVVMRHTYDELNRRTETTIDDSAWFGALPSGLRPKHRVSKVTFAYDAEGMLTLCTAYGPDSSGSEIVVAQDAYAYDGFDNLDYEQQEILAAVGTSSPKVDYSWAFSGNTTSAGSYNFNRLTGIVYPTRSGNPQPLNRTLTLNYGDNAGSVDSRLSRVTGVSDNRINATVAAYAYAGLSRRVSTALGNGVSQNYALSGGQPATSGYPALDRFGRVLDLEFRKNGGTVHRYQYGYDLAGDRMYARVTQLAEGGVSQANTRSALYGYDELKRLIAWDRGALNSSNDGISGAAAHTFDWSLDNLGNWAGDTTNPRQSVVETTTTGGTTLTKTVHHAADGRNEFGHLILTDSTTGTGSPPLEPLTAQAVYDAGGNLVFADFGVLSDDRAYWLQYDGFNRLVQVNDAGTLVAGDFLDGLTDPAQRGQLDPDALEDDPEDENDPPVHAPGELIAHFSYDGLGRVVRKESPFLPVGFSATTCTATQTTDYFYDGVRRIRERQHTPAPVDSQNQPTCSGWNVPLWRDRDYLYGPDYVDEFIAFAQDDTNPAYVIQDANYNVVGVFNKGNTSGSNLSNLLGEQYSWTPYGEVSAKAVNSGLPHSRIGHQGLFWDTLEVRGAEVLKPGDAGIYYNRNRFYSPKLGRFLNRDPNESGAPTLALAMNAQSVDALFRGFALNAQYGDGANLHAYLGANPVGNYDPTGLSWEDDADYDDAIADRVGNALYLLGTLNEAASWASIGLNTAVSIAGGLLPGSGLYDAFQAVDVIASGKGGFWEAVAIASAAFPAVKLAGEGITALRGLGKAWGWGARACTCFAPGTLVDTPAGRVAIETVNVDDEVLTRDQNDPRGAVRPGRVTQVFHTLTPVLLWLTLSNGAEIGVTPDHELWTAERGWCFAGQVQVGETVYSAGNELLEMVDIRIDRCGTNVYNLQVDGTHTFFAEGVWVHNNSCSVVAGFFVHAHHLIPKFLQGWLGGRVRGLPDHLHREYHRFLNNALARNGLPLRGNSATSKWAEVLQDPTMAARAKSALIEATGEFDQARSLGLLPALLQEMRRQGW